jgi:hypothetical protein
MALRNLCSVILLSVVAAGPVMAQDIALPSGQTVTLMGVIVEDAPAVARFRFLAPAIDPAGAGLTYEAVRDDFAVLCNDYVVPALVQSGLEVPEVVVSLSDREVEFGVAAPEATQFFEPFSLRDGRCIWEQF